MAAPGSSMPPAHSARRDPAWVRWLLTTLAVGVLTVLVVIPVICVFVEAFSRGVGTYLKNIFLDPDNRNAILLTLTVAPIAVCCNVLFGLAAAWAIVRFRFPGRTLLTAMIDLPFAISPVVAGLMFVLLFGDLGYFGPWLKQNGIQILFSTPGLILATTFVTLPFVARELIPLMEAIGPDEELAALSLGANSWQIFWRVTIPNIRWALLYGIILCNARAMGEYGAVYVVSGRIDGATNTMPLQVGTLFDGLNTPGAFALASVLTMLAAVTLVIKVGVERLARQQVQEAKAKQTAQIKE
ncbi:sulfate ABC transporter permease subunit CysW [Tuwongella immobilis]|uniref:ABC transmembrane type-1 domain-containing protein n=1 Tax=Tuwongella immobilis TaxID=692036 RepID=A0A6C2YRU7_9BACT|nr:sulfate ABC transporter permease subunit CysW [Tuwongella immobilis]VIP04390.1 sulfate abc transporter permease : Sulfate ABC transporter, inner membrane subunit CysW OS=Planctomyces limnophilus (strain ATCC 43296 / DSM 3776 / IFAM 1008 / 290) GN=Plim_3184 PE=4 SV=1: BPD_transp_1 [Tuwongella immobilis]VTS06142.1 sulfate abc transporter permease : Sulfate ABC transporter, inner membrane subunit CysW OS=Planctomyces limnophilus (strain ATCC 43296 / DSM 3776 / IFAM 1008 / 290) GN=Plim_3184 PE=4 S